jgi:general secretion pathway protein C
LSSPTCQGVQVLIVTESSDPLWSLATLREAGESRARLRRVGDGVAGRQVAFIGYNPKQQAPSVWMEGGGTLCQAMLFRAAVEVPATPARQDAAAAAATGASRNRLENPMSSLGSLRFVPAKQDGKVVGLRLFGIRPGSLLSTLGLQNGDRLESINGFDIASPQKAFEAYARLSTAKRLSVRIVRLGRPVQIDLNIS